MFGLIGIQAKIVEYALVLIIVFGTAWVVYNKGYDAAEQKALVQQAQADKEAKEKYNKIEQELEAKKNVRQQSAKVITKEVEKIVDRIVYANRCWDDDGLSIANRAISGGNQSKPETTVPTN